VCAAAGLAVALVFAGDGLRVDEAESRLRLDAGQAEATLVVRNASLKRVPVRVRVALLDPENEVRGSSETEQTLVPGRNAVHTPFAVRLPGASPEGVDLWDILWYRLEYSVTPLAPVPADVTPVEGIVAVGRITPELFCLSMAAPNGAKRGGRYVVRVRAVHPVTGRPAAQVQLKGTLTLEDEEDESGERANEAAGVTDGRGRSRCRSRSAC
jgi:hypothetical protein